MSLWTYGREYSESVLRDYLQSLQARKVNFTVSPQEMTPERGWKVDGSCAILGYERHGRPVDGGLFQRAKQGLINYDFSDPRIVVGHYDPDSPFIGRNMLLEIRIWGFRFLNGVRVHSVDERETREGTVFGFRYDTLEGHIERGYEWFCLAKDHATGRVTFRIEAHWCLGEFPNWWSRLGFAWLSPFYRHLWRQLAPVRLRELAERPAVAPLARDGLVHCGDPDPKLSNIHGRAS